MNWRFIFDYVKGFFVFVYVCACSVFQEPACSLLQSFCVLLFNHRSVLKLPRYPACFGSAVELGGCGSTPMLAHGMSWLRTQARCLILTSSSEITIISAQQQAQHVIIFTKTGTKSPSHSPSYLINEPLLTSVWVVKLTCYDHDDEQQ